MAVDWGEKRVGVALSDDRGLDVRPYCILERTSDAQVLEGLSRIISEWDVNVIVVGAPYNMDGSEGPQYERVRKVALRIEGRCRRPVWLIDERLTSHEAESGRWNKDSMDDVAAAIILKSYLDNPAAARKPFQSAGGLKGTH